MMKKLVFLISLCILIMGCDNIDLVDADRDKEDVTEPEQLEFSGFGFEFGYGFEIDHNASMLQSNCSNSSLWYVSMVSEIIDTDTINYIFNEGDEVKGNWFAITKDVSSLIVSMGKNKLPGERYLNVKVESTDLRAVEIFIKQYADSKYVESDENITKDLIGVWSLISTFNSSIKKWVDVEKDIIVEFLPDGTYRQYDNFPDLYKENTSYKINKKNFFFRSNNLDIIGDDEVAGGVWTYNYSFYDDMLKVELIWGIYDNNTPFGYIYKRIKK